MDDSIWKHRNLVFGAIAIFVYVGAEVSIGSFLVNYFHENRRSAGCRKGCGELRVVLLGWCNVGALHRIEFSWWGEGKIHVDGISALALRLFCSLIQSEIRYPPDTNRGCRILCGSRGCYLKGGRFSFWSRSRRQSIAVVATLNGGKVNGEHRVIAWHLRSVDQCAGRDFHAQHWSRRHVEHHPRRLFQLHHVSEYFHSGSGGARPSHWRRLRNYDYGHRRRGHYSAVPKAGLQTRLEFITLSFCP